MKIPNSFKDITVEQFQEVIPLYKKALEEKDTIKSLSLWAEVIAVLTDSQTDDIEALELDKLKSIIKRLEWIGNTTPKNQKFTLFLNGRLYQAPKDAKEFNTSRIIEYKTFLGRGNMIDNLHLLLATIYQPYKGWFKQSHEERAREFKKAKIGDVYGVVFFYSIQYKASIKRIQEYGLRIAKEKQKEAEALLMETLKETLEDIGAGTSR